MKRGNHYTSADLKMLAHLRDVLKMKWPQIAELMHRSQRSIEVTYSVRVKGGGQKKRDFSAPSLVRFPVSAMRPSDAMLEERERRIAAYGRRTTTAEICGDPPPAFSALDQKPGARA